MKKLIAATIVTLFLIGCNKGAFKKEQGKFKANGVQYDIVEDKTFGEYENNVSDFLLVRLTAGNNQTFQTQIRLDLSKIDVVVPINANAQSVYYVGSNSAVYYFPVSGEYKITSFKQGNPATRHAEGNFSFVGVNQYDSADTVRITDGYFYVNNF
jgi:hypothetical protein